MSCGDGDDQGFRVTTAGVEFEGYVFTVETVDVTGPDGVSFRREVIRHPGAVAVVPVHDDGTVTVVRQFRPALGTSMVEIPAGLRDVPGEPPAVTATRELREEVGLEADSIEPLVRFHTAVGMTDEEVHVFVARGLRSVADDRQGPEEAAMTVERIPLSDLAAMVADGRVTDAKTALGVSLLHRG